MKCPACGSLETGVTDSRPLLDVSIRRRRRCGCGHRFTTVEVVSVLRADDAEAHSRTVELVHAIGLLPPEDRRVLLILAKKLNGDDFRAMVTLERAA